MTPDNFQDTVPAEPDRLPRQASATLAPTPPARWWHAAVRAATFRAPFMQGLNPGPARLVLLCVLWVAIDVAIQWAALDGPAKLVPSSLMWGWWLPLMALWAAAVAARGAVRSGSEVSGAAWWALLLHLEVLILLGSGLLYLAVAHSGLGEHAQAQWVWWALYVLSLAWRGVAAAVLLCRPVARMATRAAVVAILALTVALQVLSPPPASWMPVEDPSNQAAARPVLQLSQAVLEAQADTLPDALATLSPQRPGVVDMYVLTFAPFADEDVFRRESAMVAEVMRSRFDADRRVVELVNHPKTAATLPWATPENLARAIRRVSQLMDPREDILFIHLTSHGARDGQLAARLWPLDVAPVTPQQLKAWLDAAGVVHRVVSVSACYSGTWLEPLSHEGTLVMTAADAQNTSYGCGRLSELTFFGRAMFDEQLRGTRSFESAHAAAREVIAQREQEAGKSDGYSNPQIQIGASIRPALAALVSRLEGATAAPMQDSPPATGQ